MTNKEIGMELSLHGRTQNTTKSPIFDRNLAGIRAKRTRFPPYGKAVTATSNVFIFAGPDAWNRAKQRKAGNAMVLPEGDEPASYKWPVYGLEVMLIWPGALRESVIDFGELLIRTGAELVVAPFKGEPSGGFFFRSTP